MSTAAELRPETASPSASPQAPASKTGGFWALIATQFQGAFSDNVLRYLLLGIVVGPGLSEESGNRLVSVIMLLFSRPSSCSA